MVYNCPLKVLSALIFFEVHWIISVSLSCMTPLMGVFDTTDGSVMSDYTHVLSPCVITPLMLFNV